MEVKNVYRQGAEDGVFFGILLTMISLSFIYSGKSSIISVLAVVLLLLPPVALFVSQRRYAARMSNFADVPALWMLGLMTSLCGSLICGAVTYCWLQFIEPSFIYDQVQGAIDVWKQVPEMAGDPMLKDMQNAIDRGMLPSAIEFVMNMILLTTFLGSVQSLLLGAVVRFLAIKDQKKNETR